MLLFRKKITGWDTFTSEAVSGVFPYLAASSNPDTGQWDDITNVENWDLYGAYTELNTSQIRDEIKALYVSWAASSANEKKVFAQYFVAAKSDRDTIYSASEQKAFALSVIYGGEETMHVQNSITMADDIANGDASVCDAAMVEMAANVSWKPNSIPLGAVLSSGATFFVNGGAGVLLSFSGSSDNSIFFNDSLNKPGHSYDGSDLALKLHGRISTNGGGGDTVGFIVEYAFIKGGDNSNTKVTTIAQQNIDVSSKLANIDFYIVLGNMIGEVGSDSILVTITRNAAGAGSDSYAGDYDLTALEWVKI